ncbi:peptide resistance ABC transporter activity modulator VraH, partial [Staphylococcus aureus]
SYEDLKNLTVTWYNVIALAIIVIVLSSVTTPIIGIPAGLLGGAYYLKRREEKGK